MGNEVELKLPSQPHTWPAAALLGGRRENISVATGSSLGQPWPWEVLLLPLLSQGVGCGWKQLREALFLPEYS